MTELVKHLFFYGPVVRGFGRGSKQLGIPTANYPKEVVDQLPANIDVGVFCGFAQVENGEIHPMVMSIGFNPFFKNKLKSMETHIIHKFERDFYGKTLKILMTHFLRNEKNYDSLDALIQDIHNDIRTATELVQKINLTDIVTYFQ
ncbi:hypothetical protein Ciccas_007728 [Cichlidogyrus casuarinus]|uniref:riboflavin kinase n=1 Tax=Cichlidogyrus casuarinus TaxID=1844966 RepID=A0ABD2Q232_9PLAT